MEGGLPPPQVIRRADGSFVLLNVDLTGLTAVQRVAVGVTVWDQVRVLLEQAGEYRPLDKHNPHIPPIGRVKDIAQAVATIVGVAPSSLYHSYPRLCRRPDVLGRARAGEIATGSDLFRALDYKLIETLAEGRPSKAKRIASYYGKGDKFDLALEPIARYLRAWGKKDFRFTHVPPKEAQRRVRRIDKTIEDLEKAKEDLVNRSHVAKYTAPSERKRKENLS